MSERVCPVRDCGAVLGVSPTTGVPRLMCPRHWHMAPRTLQLRIADLYAHLLDLDGKNADAIRRDLLTALGAACRKAELQEGSQLRRA